MKLQACVEISRKNETPILILTSLQAGFPSDTAASFVPRTYKLLQDGKVFSSETANVL